jgi:excisionase family DNA binding protein
MKQGPLPNCFECKYFRGAKSGICDAFPDQIPLEIWSGKVQHNKPFTGDQGIWFQPNENSEFLGVNELSKLLDVNMKTVYRALWSKKIPAYKIGRMWRVAKRDLESIKK